MLKNTFFSGVAAAVIALSGSGAEAQFYRPMPGGQGYYHQMPGPRPMPGPGFNRPMPGAYGFRPAPFGPRPYYGPVAGMPRPWGAPAFLPPMMPAPVPYNQPVAQPQPAPQPSQNSGGGDIDWSQVQQGAEAVGTLCLEFCGALF